jgi:FKBP-type peptidyl-prolyl cis-trans isomerase
MFFYFYKGISMKRILVSVVVMLGVGLTSALAKEVKTEDAKKSTKAEKKESAFKTEKDKVSYAIGCQIGESFKKAEIDVNLKVLMKAIEDKISDKTPVMTEEEIQTTMQEFQKNMSEKMQSKMKKIGEKNLAEAKTFLDANGKKEGIKTLTSGVQYKVLTASKGGKSPKATDSVKVNYEGKFIDGKVFDSSYKRNQAAEFVVNQVIPGWTEVLQLMKEGDVWEVYIPPALAYGDMGRPSIEPNSLLIFKVELVSVIEKPADNTTAMPELKK